MTVKVRNLENLSALRYLVYCNVLHLCNVRAIPTYRVYRLYDDINYLRVSLRRRRHLLLGYQITVFLTGIAGT